MGNEQVVLALKPCANFQGSLDSFTRESVVVVAGVPSELEILRHSLPPFARAVFFQIHATGDQSPARGCVVTCAGAGAHGNQRVAQSTLDCERAVGDGCTKTTFRPSRYLPVRRRRAIPSGSCHGQKRCNRHFRMTAKEQSMGESALHDVRRTQMMVVVLAAVAYFRISS